MVCKRTKCYQMSLLNRRNRMEQGMYACARARICHVCCTRSQHWSLARAIYNIPGDTGCYISLHYSYRAFMLPSLRAHACVRVRRVVDRVNRECVHSFTYIQRASPASFFEDYSRKILNLICHFLFLPKIVSCAKMRYE